jgi:cytochrome o ubiquinol oxidase subunit 3
MTITAEESATIPEDPYRLGHHHPPHGHAPGRGDGGPAAKRIIVGYGFWIFLLSDIVMFSAFFAAYAVLKDNVAGGPSGHELFDLNNVKIETACLLISSFVCGLASVAAEARSALWYQVAMAITFVFGAAFILLELREFAGLVAAGNGPQRSAFLTAFFSLVGCHGLHVSGGLLWLLTMMAQIFAKGFRPDIQRRFMCFSLFWHALDIIWVALFTVVYLLGAIG